MLSFIAVKLSVSHLLKKGESREFSFRISQFVKKPRLCRG
jgi:hypothetical protein